MLIDARLEFSVAQALTANDQSTNIVDLTTVRQIGKGRMMFVLINVDVAADFTTGNETYQFDLITDSAAADPFGSAVVLDSRTIIAATLVAGFIFTLNFPQTEVERFLAISYVLGGTTPLITVSAWLSDQEPGIYESYDDALPAGL